MGVNTGTSRSHGGLKVNDNNGASTVYGYGITEIVVTAGSLTYDGHGKVTINTGGGGGGGITFNGSTANGVVTYGGATTADVESNLTFDGGTLAITGKLTTTTSVGATTTVSAGTSVSAATTVTAGTGVTATTGNISTTNGAIESNGVNANITSALDIVADRDLITSGSLSNASLIEIGAGGAITDSTTNSHASNFLVTGGASSSALTDGGSGSSWIKGQTITIFHVFDGINSLVVTGKFGAMVVGPDTAPPFTQITFPDPSCSVTLLNCDTVPTSTSGGWLILSQAGRPEFA